MAAAISEALVRYTAELELAGPNWERQPAGSPEGEAAWSARQVAEHIATASTFLGGQIARAIAAPAPEMNQYSFDSHGDALAATNSVYKVLNGTFANVNDQQLGQEIELGRLGTRSLSAMLSMMAQHLDDHANQLKALREGA